MHPLCCPDDHTPLELSPHGAYCPACRRPFPAPDGILSLLPADDAWTAGERTEVTSERARRDAEAAAYDRLPGLRLLSFLEIPLTLGRLNAGPADRLLEVGCGTGRFTTRVAPCVGEVVAVDHSRESLKLLRGKLPATLTGRVQAVQADATRLPVRDGWATRALSCQMLEHLPTPGLRAKAVAELARALAPGGRLALSAYWHVPLLRRWLPREGHHSGAIYFHRFAREELARLLRPHFHVERLTGRLGYVLLAHCRRSGAG